MVKHVLRDFHHGLLRVAEHYHRGRRQFVLLPVGETGGGFERLLQRHCHGQGSGLDDTKVCSEISAPTRWHLRRTFGISRARQRGGGMRWNSRWVNVSIVCVGEYVGLEEIADGIWNVYFGPLRLGRLNERHLRIEDEYGRLYRRHG